MPSSFPLALSVLLLAWFAQAVGAAWMLAVTRHRFRKSLRRAPSAEAAAFTPPAVVIVPFKGVDPGLDATLDALFTQDYPTYTLSLVVEAEDDDAVPTLRAAIQRHPGRDAQLLVAGHAPPTRGQKVHNLLAALDTLPPLPAMDGERVACPAPVVAFADSDAAGDPHWLRALVRPLRKPEVGCATGYRWLFPVPRADTGRVHPASHVASLLNASVVSFMGNRRWHRPWGGSMALRLADVQQGLADAWAGTVSDDLTVDHFVKQRGQQVQFVPDCLLRSPCDYDWAGLWAFAVRQHTIVRVHEPAVFFAALPWPLIYLAGMVASIVALTQGLWLPALLATGTVIVADQARAAQRRALLTDRFGPDALDDLRLAARLDRYATPLWLALHAAVMLRAATTRTIAWRGRRYRLTSPTDTRELPA